MNTKYLAYIALLAGWICFCYWLYAKALYPRFHTDQETSWPEYSEQLSYPLAYRWTSDVPLAGPGFGKLKHQLQGLDSTDAIVIIRGYYFRDEMDSISFLEKLARQRIQHMLKYITVDRDRMLIEILPQEINADVKTHPFEAVQFDVLAFSDIMSIHADTVEICFPLKDSLQLPVLCFDRLAEWGHLHHKKKESVIHLTGIADGSGIAESSEVAIDRAMVIKNELIKEGWKADLIQLTAGQRNLPLSLRNRCVIVYFE